MRENPLLLGVAIFGLSSLLSIERRTSDGNAFFNKELQQRA